MLVTVIDNTGEKNSTGGGVWGIKKDNCSAEISHDPYFEEGPFSLSTKGGIESRNIPVTTFYYTNASSESKTVRKKAVTVKGALKINKAKGKVSCKIQSAPKAIKKYLKINSKGVITINKWKAAKKGSYSVKVKVTAKGNNNYKSATKTVKAKIKIK